MQPLRDVRDFQPSTGRIQHVTLRFPATPFQTHEPLVLLQCVLPFTDRHLSNAEQMPEFTTGARYAA
ncbi:hypothetical protein WS86_08980 [Burkholderia savannae]|nr:hypothetical protein WS86_08980 [Burkholderia savannae]